MCIRDRYNGMGVVVLDYNKMNGGALEDISPEFYVKDCMFTNMERIGMMCFGVDKCYFENNVYIGKGNGDWLDYGIEIGGGGIATITGNDISGCTGVASVDGSVSGGILVTTYYGEGTSAEIQGNVLHDNTEGIGIGYGSGDSSTVAVNGNNEIYNNDYGIITSESTSISLTVNHNNIYDNSNMGLDVTNGPSVNAEDNWWGSTTGPTHSSNPTGSGDSVSDNVDYDPWLCEPYPTGWVSVDGQCLASPPPGPGTSAPEVFLAYRAFDIGIDIDGSGSTVNPGDIRNANYAFTGERLFYFVLVRDDNGAEDINVVRWVKEEVGVPEVQEGPCDWLPVDDMHLPDDLECCRDYIVAALTNLAYDDQTDKVYMCVLTVESQWGGADPAIYIEAEDQSEGTGQMLSEYWTFNPALTVSLQPDVGDALTFDPVMEDQAPMCVRAPHCTRDYESGEDQQNRDCTLYDCGEPGEKLCDIQFSANKLVLKNLGIAELWPFIAATNFYASDGMAKCPYTNELDANQFEYRATQGTWDSGWRIMPQYAPDLGCNGPGLWSQCRGGCRITTGCPMNTLTTGNSIAIQLKIVWPTPCIGTFDVGTFYAIVRAV